ncbi:MAG: aldehyde dehydrogenase family protein [Actinobacteria bacterium]|nr:aldehyde dehydrogenase family protein [Actinomycetota bacterium]
MARTGDSVVTSRNPATGTLVAETPVSSPEEITRVVHRARDAFGSWSSLPAESRADLLVRFAELVERDRDELAALVVAEVGKLRTEAEGEVDWTAASARWYAEHLPRGERRGTATVIRRPLGVVAAVTPWNSPLITPAWKWLPAFAAGNTVVWKPSELATATALAATELWREAGLPDGVLGLVAGGGDTGRAVCEDAAVDAVHFTGSTETGRAVAGLAAARSARCVLELGGLNSAIVFADADLEQAADCIVAAAVAVNGQKCTSARRALVERGVEAELLSALTTRIESLRLGNPADPAATLGPLITPAARARAERQLERAAGAGAEIVARAPALDDPGLDEAGFFRAALVRGVPAEDPLRRRELFAPVLSLESFDSDEDAWRIANDTPYGLAAAVYTSSAERMEAAQERLEVGVVAVNQRCDSAELEAPFGGAKASGNGFPEGGEYAYGGVTMLKAVYVAPAQP